MTGWLLCTYLNALGIVEIASFDETCKLIDEIPEIAATSFSKKFKAKKELTADDFIDLHRIVKKSAAGEVP
jgi:hypothetical protein